ADNLNRPVGITFDDNGQMYLWEKQGVVSIVENGIKRSPALIDIQEEVSSYGDLGLTGVVLDPNFMSNGYLYLYYTVDKHHLLYAGTPTYNPNITINRVPTIARITRYQADKNTNFTTLVPNSRYVLLGSDAQDGLPIMSATHGNGCLQFGTDGSLLVAIGDTYLNGSNFQTEAYAEGLITAEDTVGPWRSQSLNNPNGKILRINPSNGNGYESNPFFESGNPRSAASRIYALGLRNPFRFIVKPNTGSHNTSDGSPGVLVVGDVGENQWEELNIISNPGGNYGWPAYVGISAFNNYNHFDQAVAYPSPGGCSKPFYQFRDFLSTDGNWPDPCNPGFPLEPAQYPLWTYLPPALDYSHHQPVARIANGYVPDTLGQTGSGITGESFQGKCVIAGIYYQGSEFPSQYQNRYFQPDFSSGWIRIFDFDPQTHQLSNVEIFQSSNANNISWLASSPVEGGIFYVNNLDHQIRKIVYEPDNLPPVAHITQDKVYGPEPLNVQFSGAGSYDPDADPITYEWNFADGSPVVNSANPSHVFNSGTGQPTAYYLSLMVTDTNGEYNTKTQVISVNNTPPVIQSTSLDNVSAYPMSFPSSYPLSAVVTDAEHSANELSYTWMSSLYHDNHFHPEPEEQVPTTSLFVSNIGCDTVLYFVRTQLIVEDAAGLSDTALIDLYPDCGGPLVQTDWLEFDASQSTVLNVLANDQSNGSPLDSSSVRIISGPRYGSANVNTASGEINYTPSASNEEDQLTYMISDQAGNPSALGQVNLSPIFTTSLPIQWLNFQARATQDAIQLEWLVAGELAGEYIIERSGNPQNFSPLAKVPSTNTRIYHHIDQSPLPGINYYRLRYIDAEGETDFSPVRKVLNAPAAISALQLYPNPVVRGQDIVIQIEAEDDVPKQLEVYDVHGRKLFEQQNIFPGSEIRLSSNHWPAGTYLVHLIQENSLKTAKLIIQ
ncbi:MAG: PQQ-dependent sugar dehydrogenase, partial [Bacteroidota bacterium]